METTTKTQETNKAIARQFFENFAKGNLNQVENLLGTNYKLHFPGRTGSIDKEESKQLMKTYNTAFPDLKFSVEDQFAENDLVATRISSRGTHKGEFQGIIATNKRVSVTGTSIHRIVNNKIVEEWTEYDALGMMQQLGVVSSEPAHAQH